MDFKIDENLPNEVAQLLADAGHSVSTVLGEGLGGAPDDAVIQAAREEGRIFVTVDTGFTDIRRYPPSEFPGLIAFRPRRLDKAHLLEVLHRVMGRFDTEPKVAKLWIVEDRRGPHPKLKHQPGRLTTRWSRPGPLRRFGSKIGPKSWPGGSSQSR